MVAEQALDIRMLKNLNSKNWLRAESSRYSTHHRRRMEGFQYTKTRGYAQSLSMPSEKMTAER
jgi:hypothetical protein